VTSTIDRQQRPAADGCEQLITSALSSHASQLVGSRRVRAALSTSHQACHAWLVTVRVASCIAVDRNMVEIAPMSSQTPTSYSTLHTLGGLS